MCPVRLADLFSLHQERNEEGALKDVFSFGTLAPDNPHRQERR